MGLPPLPKKIKLGSAGFVSNSLLVCGGETNLQNQNSDCWVLKQGSTTWRSLEVLSGSRSQAASSVSGAGSVLRIFGGFSEKVDGWALDTQQAVEVTGHSFLQPLGGKKTSFSSRLASAVTLLSGDYILTGGRESGRDVQLLSGTKKQTWTKLSSMLNSRYAHASSPIYLHDEEYVIVAGGYDNLHKPQVTVEIYNFMKIFGLF